MDIHIIIFTCRNQSRLFHLKTARALATALLDIGHFFPFLTTLRDQCEHNTDVFLPCNYSTYYHKQNELKVEQNLGSKAHCLLVKTNRQILQKSLYTLCIRYHSTNLQNPLFPLRFFLEKRN